MRGANDEILSGPSSLTGMPWRMHLLIGVLGLFMVCMIAYGFYEGQRMGATDAPLIDATMEIKLQATTAHLWFEEIISGDRHEKIETVWQLLDEADWYARAMLEGGSNSGGVFVPLEDGKMRSEIRAVREKLAALRQATRDRLAVGDAAGIGSEMDQQYDAAFADFIQQADDVETRLLAVISADLRRFQWTQACLIGTSTLVWITVALSFHWFHRRRAIALQQISAVNRTLVTEMAERQRAEQSLRDTQQELFDHQRQEKELVETELGKTREELVKKTRLATLGQLTATVSHEIRNPLGTIRTAVYSVAEKVRGQVPLVDRALDRAERNIVRCDQIIEELLSYTRTKEPNLVTTDIDRWLAAVLDEQDIPERISVTRGLNAGIELDVDQEQLRRCVVNLLTNACQAMTELVADAGLTIQTATEDGRLLIRVRDTGRGIEKEVMDRIFEPLYTTKGFGVGLGLPMVDQLMRQFDGGITIQSEPGQGTTATLWLPLPPE